VRRLRQGEQIAPRQPDIVKEVIARRIISLAQKGERDPDRLCARALAALGDKAVLEK